MTKELEDRFRIQNDLPDWDKILKYVACNSASFCNFFLSLPLLSASGCMARCSPSRHRCLFQVLFLIQFFQVGGLSAHKKPWLGTGPITWISLSRQHDKWWAWLSAGGWPEHAEPKCSAIWNKTNPGHSFLSCTSNEFHICCIMHFSHALLNRVTLLPICNAYSLLPVATLCLALPVFLHIWTFPRCVSLHTVIYVSV